MQIIIGSDDFGAPLKESLVAHLRDQSYDVVDVGIQPYFNVAACVAQNVKSYASCAPHDVRGVLVCGTGMGVSIMANKFSGIRAAVCENEVAARRSRAINDANVLTLGSMVTPPEVGIKIIDAFIEQEFCRPPVPMGAPAPAWWNEEVECFLRQKWESILEVERCAALEPIPASHSSCCGDHTPLVAF